MLFLISEDKKVKESIEETSFSEWGILEREHLEKWIEDNPKMLNEELMVITTEYDGFDKTKKRLDILAIDPHGKIVIIELKRDMANAFVDLQAIHYAAYCSTLNIDQIIEIKANYDNISSDEAEEEIKSFITKMDFIDFDNEPRIILVANDFLGETLAAVLWLIDRGIEIKCVKLEPYVVGNQLAVKPEVIIPLPEAEDYMMKIVAKKQRISIETKINNDYSNFWDLIYSKIENERSELTEKFRKGGNLCSILTGYGNVHFECRFARKPAELQLSLDFEKSSSEENNELLNYFYSIKDKIQQGIDDKLIFDENFGNKWTRIYIKREDVSLTEDNANWGYENMVKFFDNMKPYLDEYFKK